MSILRTLLILFAALALQGCLEGGIGGTGTGPGMNGPAGDTDDSGPDAGDNASDSVAALVGFANKGPYAAGADITATVLGEAEPATAQTSGELGRFTVSAVPGQALLFEVSGLYFSEHGGAISHEQVPLSAVIEAGSAGANVNVATHLIHLRVLNLVDGGMLLSEAITMAESELLLALGEVVPSPANPIRFSELMVLNGFQALDNPEGNAWLLALTSMVERAAVIASEDSGESVEFELGFLCDVLARGLEESGTINAALLGALIEARANLDPDAVHTNLFELAGRNLDQLDHVDDATAIADLQTMVDDTLVQYRCEAFGAEVVCADADPFPQGSKTQVLAQLGESGDTQVSTTTLELLVADMNRFVDTDGDGLVNRDDDDDDDDGVADPEDESPYGN